MEIFKLFGSIFVDNEKANKSIGKTDKKAQGLATTFVKGAKTAAKVGTAIGGMAAVGGAALLGIANKTADVTDRIDKMSQKLGLSREGFQEWDFVLSQAGVSIDSMQTGMKTLSQRMGDALEGTGKGAELFDQLGLSITESMTQEEVFNATIESLQNMEDGVEKAALAQELFGRSGQDLLPLLNSTAESTDELKNKAQELGLVMGDEAIDAGVQFTDTMDQLKRSFQTAGVGIGAQLLPIVQKFAQWVIDNMPQIQAFMQKAFDVIGAVVTKTIDVFNAHLLPVFITIFEWVKDNMPQIKQFFKTSFETIKTVTEIAIKVFNEKLLPVIKLFWELVKMAMPLIRTLFEGAFNIIKALVMAAWDIFDKFFLPVLKVLFEWIRDNMPKIQSFFETAFDVIEFAINLVIDVLNTYFDILGKIFDFVKGTFRGIGNLIMRAFDGVTGFLDGIVEKFNKVKDTIVGAINKVKEFVGIDTKADEKTTDLTDRTSVRNVQGLFNGGTTLTDGVIKVGERGPELLSVGKGARVKPLDQEEQKQMVQEINNNFTIGELVVREDADVEKIARELYNLQVATNRGGGVG